MLVFIFVCDIIDKRFEERSSFKSVRDLFKTGSTVLGLGVNDERLVFTHCRNKIFESRHKKFYSRTGYLEVEQSVAHIHIEESSLPLRNTAYFFFAADFAAVFLELFGRKRRDVILALYKIVSVFAEDSLRQRIDVHYSRSLDIDDKVYRRIFAQCVQSVFLRLFKRNSADRIRHGYKRKIVDAFFGFLKYEIHVIAYEKGQTFVCSEYAHIPFVAYMRNNAVLTVCLYERCVQQSKFCRRGYLALEQILVRLYHLALAFVRLEIFKTLIVEYTECCRKIIADIVFIRICGISAL